MNAIHNIDMHHVYVSFESYNRKRRASTTGKTNVKWETFRCGVVMSYTIWGRDDLMNGNENKLPIL